MVEWHKKDLTPEDIQKIIREGRNKEDNTTFDSLSEYTEYVYKDNERILEDHDHSNCEPNDITKAAMEEANDMGDYIPEKVKFVNFQDFLDELRNDREERDEQLLNAIKEARGEKFISSVDGSEHTFEEILEEMFEDNEEILDKLGSDYDEDGVPYWDKK
jgi:hypothetical protein